VIKSQFIKDITSRNGEGSSKKLWYNGACLFSTIMMLYITYKQPTEYGFEDWAYVCLVLVYLGCVGGFDVILEMMRLLVQFKNGSVGTEITKTSTEVKTQTKTV
jgi:hypothetical protein